MSPLGAERLLPRRGLLGLGFAGSVGGLLMSTMELTVPRLAGARATLSPDATADELTKGNKRFTSGQLTAHEENLAILRQKTVKKQEPFAAVLSCADARVPAEIVFDQSVGHIFVTRVAGNIVIPEVIASLEYGAAVFGTTVILVGQSGCGAVKAPIQGKEARGQISALFPHIQSAVARAGPNLKAGDTGQPQNTGATPTRCVNGHFRHHQGKQVEGRGWVIRSGNGLGRVPDLAWHSCWQRKPRRED